MSRFKIELEAESETYQDMPIERWKTIMLEHVIRLRSERDRAIHEKNLANMRAVKAAKEGAAQKRAEKLQARLDEAVNTISHLQRKLMEKGIDDLNVERMKHRLVEEALRRSNNVIAHAAEMLGIDRGSLYNHMKSLKKKQAIEEMSAAG